MIFNIEPEYIETVFRNILYSLYEMYVENDKIIYEYFKNNEVANDKEFNIKVFKKYGYLTSVLNIISNSLTTETSEKLMENIKKFFDSFEKNSYLFDNKGKDSISIQIKPVVFLSDVARVTSKNSYDGCITKLIPLMYACAEINPKYKKFDYELGVNFNDRYDLFVSILDIINKFIVFIANKNSCKEVGLNSIQEFEYSNITSVDENNKCNIDTLIEEYLKLITSSALIALSISHSKSMQKESNIFDRIGISKTLYDDLKKLNRDTGYDNRQFVIKFNRLSRIIDQCRKNLFTKRMIDIIENIYTSSFNTNINLSYDNNIIDIKQFVSNTRNIIGNNVVDYIESAKDICKCNTNFLLDIKDVYFDIFEITFFRKNLLKILVDFVDYNFAYTTATNKPRLYQENNPYNADEPNNFLNFDNVISLLKNMVDSEKYYKNGIYTKNNILNDFYKFYKINENYICNKYKNITFENGKEYYSKIISIMQDIDSGIERIKNIIDNVDDFKKDAYELRNEGDVVNNIMNYSVYKDSVVEFDDLFKNMHKRIDDFLESVAIVNKSLYNRNSEIKNSFYHGENSILGSFYQQIVKNALIYMTNFIDSYFNEYKNTFVSNNPLSEGYDYKQKSEYDIAYPSSKDSLYLSSLEDSEPEMKKTNISNTISAKSIGNDFENESGEISTESNDFKDYVYKTLNGNNVSVEDIKKYILEKYSNEGMFGGGIYDSLSGITTVVIENESDTNRYIEENEEKITPEEKEKLEEELKKTQESYDYLADKIKKYVKANVKYFGL